ncbi:MAG: hypothetical protein MZV70_44120 [Desulfobacterales bacterium]|nr:hypothetical protein [Desulfobacterales bacterium]
MTTEPIAEAMRGMVDDIPVMPNYLERFPGWGDLQPPRNERRKLRGRGGPARSSIRAIWNSSCRWSRRSANEVDWIFMGMCPPKLPIPRCRSAIRRSRSTNIRPSWQSSISTSRCALLELNRFNAAKSNSAVAGVRRGGLSGDRHRYPAVPGRPA